MKPALAFALLAFAACSPKPASSLVPDLGDGGDGGEAPDAGLDAGVCGCASWGTPRSNGLLGDPELLELSGLVASRAHPGVLYAHNDSGDTARFFALSTSGEALGRFLLPGAVARDWEDIALGPCDAGACLYLGDIGDNNFVRTDYAVFRVAEPAALPADGGTVSVAFERIAYEYPGGDKHNCESLFAHPVTGRLYLVTKENSGPSQVYRFPEALDPQGVNVLDYVATLTVPTPTDGRLTGADVSPCGDAVLLRMYNRMVELRLPAGEANFEALFSAPPLQVPVAGELQGEAVAYSADGMSYFTASERVTDPVQLNEVRCR
ncbi:MAG: hypothetical protein AB1938_00410 [Myxococcota bacterium]